MAVENDSLHYLYIRSFENTRWGLARGRFGVSGRPRGGFWEAAWRHLDVLGCRLRLCGSVLEGRVFAGDLIIAVNDADTREMNAEDVMEIMSHYANSERKLTLLHSS